MRPIRHQLIALTAVTTAVGIVASLAVQAAQASPRAAHHVRTAATNARHVRARATPHQNTVLFGLDDHWESNIVADDRQLSAKSGIVGTFLSWHESSMSPRREANAVVNYSRWANSRGAVPMIDLSPPKSVTLRSIVAGSQDSALRQYAEALHRWNHQFLFRLFPEMNGSWESYSPGVHGNTTAQFRAAWRHIVRLFRRYHATKVRFVWNVDKELNRPRVTLRSLWPGNQYVDWTGIDVFDREDKAHGTFPNPVTALRHTVADIHRLTHKPIILAESGTVSSARKGSWIRELFSGTSKLGVKAVVYFNEVVHPTASTTINWRLNSTQAALRASKQTLKGAAVAWPGHNHGSLRNDQSLIAHGHW